MCRIFLDYLELAKKRTVLIDFAAAAVLSWLVTFLISMLNLPAQGALQKIGDFTKLIIPTFAIQAGFHGTSLSIFSSSNTGMAKFLKETRIENTNRRLIEQVYAYFSWAVIVQLALLLYSVFVYYAIIYFPDKHSFWHTSLGGTLPWYIGGSLLLGILYALLLSIRNVGILYIFLVSSARHTGKEERT